MSDDTEDQALITRISGWLASTQHADSPYEVSVAGRTFVVLPGVFSPAYYSETAFYASALVNWYRSGMRFLDVGCGVGVNSVLAALAGASVVALDINESAVANAALNARRHDVDARVEVRRSDIFSAVEPEERFDLIYWNVPFTFRGEGVILTSLEESIFDPGYRKNRDFLRGAHDHLAPGGTVLMGISPTLGRERAIRELADAEGITRGLVAEAQEEGTAELFQLVRLDRTGVT